MLIPVILSGGAGTRLWPVSREAHPKPFMKLVDGDTLMKKTFQRARSIASDHETLVVTNQDYYFLTKDELAQQNQKDSSNRVVYLLEPEGRNTAPAIALAALLVSERHSPTACLAVLAADHLIHQTDRFAGDFQRARRLAEQGYLVTFGIPPTSPETGYGYIEQGDALGSDGSSSQVRRFVEKPDLARATEYLAAGNYLWNSGMFVFQAGRYLEELERHAPDVHRNALECWAAIKSGKRTSKDVVEIPAEPFAQAPNISVDYAVMERSDRVAVVRASFDWSDIGSWDSVSRLVESDDDGNRAIGNAMFIGTQNTFVQSDDRLVAAVGTQNLLIIDTPDALLVANQDRAQDVKEVVGRLRQEGHETYKLHRTVSRPWGTYTILGEGPRFKIKRIEVKPGASLSLQMHHHRSEHWIVVSGMAKVVNGEQELFVSTNESTYIPAGFRHRLENPGVVDLVMIEVQSGEYLGEDDIVRFEDQYGRA